MDYEDRWIKRIPFFLFFLAFLPFFLTFSNSFGLLPGNAQRGLFFPPSCLPFFFDGVDSLARFRLVHAGSRPRAPRCFIAANHRHSSLPFFLSFTLSAALTTLALDACVALLLPILPPLLSISRGYARPLFIFHPASLLPLLRVSRTYLHFFIIRHFIFFLEERRRSHVLWGRKEEKKFDIQRNSNRSP